MLTNIYSTLLAALRRARPSKRPNTEIVVSKEVSDFLNGAFDEGHKACAKAARLGFYDQKAGMEGGQTDPNAHFGQVTQNPWQGNRPLQHRSIPNSVRPCGLYDDRIIPGGGENIGMVGAPSRLIFPLTPEEVEYFRDYYGRVFGVESEVFDKFVQEHQIAPGLTGTPFKTTEELQEYLENKLTPQLATVDGQLVKKEE